MINKSKHNKQNKIRKTIKKNQNSSNSINKNKMKNQLNLNNKIEITKMITINMLTVDNLN